LKCTVHSILYQMDYEEFIGWVDYLELRPIGWRDDDRAYKLMRIQGHKESPENTFDSLRSIRRRSEEAKNKLNEEGKTNISSLKTSSFLQKLNRAQGGKHIPND